MSHPRHHDGGRTPPPSGEDLDLVIEHLRALADAMNHSATNNAPISPAMLREVQSIIDAVSGAARR